MTTTQTWTGRRRLGRSGIEVSAMGLCCWAIGGPAWLDGKPIGWGEVDDDESVRAIRRALDLGITFFDTAGAVDAGHSERILGRALAAAATRPRSRPSSASASTRPGAR